MNRDLLRKPFDASLHKRRKGPDGRELVYVDVATVIARLNEACEQWDFHVDRYELLEEEVVVVGRLVSEGCIKVAFGGSRITRDRSGMQVSLADDLKAAASDALKKAATLLGVGLELYGLASSKQDTVQNPELLTRRQHAAVESAVSRRRLAGEDLESLLLRRFNKKELAVLTRREASALLTELSSASVTRH